MRSIRICLFIHFACLLMGCERSERGAPHESTLADPSVLLLDQGWNTAQREWFQHSANQGSHLIPYDWFLCLEDEKSRKSLRDNEHVNRWGFIVDSIKSRANPDGLPVGFVKDDVPDKDGTCWLGLTCAACHTAEIKYRCSRYRIDGAPAQADLQSFLQALTGSLKTTADDEGKFDRFAQQILRESESGRNDQAREKLRQDLRTCAASREEFDNRNQTDSRYGYARVDASGIIMNEVLGHALNVDCNVKPPNAPVSFPFLWDTPQHDFVQWNGIAPNRPSGTHIVGPLSRNVREVLGVFGTVKIGEDKDEVKGYESSVRRLNLIMTEELLKKLNSPQWPAEFPPINRDLAAKGRELYERHCISCHDYIERAAVDRTVRAILTPINEVGTDPLMATNFANRMAKTGRLKGRKKFFVAGGEIADAAPAGQILAHIAAGTILHQPFEPVGFDEFVKFEKLLSGGVLIELAKSRAREIKLAVDSGDTQSIMQLVRPMLNDVPASAPTYKARPLNGIWATAPYLHNGSVPNLAELLLPAKQRSKTFYLGSREFDPVNVGLVSDNKAKDAFEFRAIDKVGKPIPGNSNAGHEYGKLNAEERAQLLEFLKTL